MLKRAISLALQTLSFAFAQMTMAAIVT